MSGSPKKTDTEKAATRQAQNKRYRSKKRAAGLRMISVWAPADLVTPSTIAGFFLATGEVVFLSKQEGWKKKKVAQWVDD